MRALSLNDRVLGWILGLGDLGENKLICHGYRNACRCSECVERAENPEPTEIRQPWQPKRTAA